MPDPRIWRFPRLARPPRRYLPHRCTDPPAARRSRRPPGAAARHRTPATRPWWPETAV